MKWKEFKAIIESQGVNDNTDIAYIDTDMYKPKVTYTVRKVYIE